MTNDTDAKWTDVMIDVMGGTTEDKRDGAPNQTIGIPINPIDYPHPPCEATPPPHAAATPPPLNPNLL